MHLVQMSMSWVPLCYWVQIGVNPRSHHNMQSSASKTAVLWVHDLAKTRAVPPCVVIFCVSVNKVLCWELVPCCDCPVGRGLASRWAVGRLCCCPDLAACLMAPTIREEDGREETRDADPGHNADLDLDDERSELQHILELLLLLLVQETELSDRSDVTRHSQWTDMHSQFWIGGKLVPTESTR
jgi:hypothetical protein